MKEDKKPSNPNAFPNDIHESMNESEYKHKGMTLRDYFAAKAMQSILNGIYSNNTLTPSTMSDSFELVSKNAYWFADEMLKQREL